MPIYEYQCKDCNELFEQFVRSTSSTQTVECPRCGSEKVTKAISLFGLAGGSRSSDATPACTSGPV